MNAPSPADIQNLAALLSAGQFDKGVSTAKRLIGRFPREPALHLLLGAGLAKQEKLDPAVHSYRKALALKPDYAEALDHLGFALHKQGKLTEAADAYAAAVKIQPANAKFQDSLGRILEELAVGHFAKRQFADAAELFRRAVAIRPRSGELLTNLGRCLFQLGEAEEASSYLHRAQQLGPGEISETEKIRAVAYDAIALKSLGKPNTETLKKIFDIPTDHWESVSIKMWAALASGDPEKAFSYRPGKLNVISWGDLGSLYRRSDLQARIEALPKLDGSPPGKAVRPLIYAAADGVYAGIFADGLISSALARSPDCDFHLHLMNPGPYKPEEALAKFPKDRVSWSSETFGNGDKIIYSTRRFVRLAQFIHHIERVVIAVDMDSVINGDLLKALPDHFDVVLYDRPDDPWFHQTVNAGFMAISPGGKDFVDFLAAYILHFEEQGTLSWFVDQAGISAARAWLGSNAPGLAIKAAPAHVMDWRVDHAPESLIWHAKGNLKHARP